MNGHVSADEVIGKSEKRDQVVVTGASFCTVTQTKSNTISTSLFTEDITEKNSSRIFGQNGSSSPWVARNMQARSRISVHRTSESDGVEVSVRDGVEVDVREQREGENAEGKEIDESIIGDC